MLESVIIILHLVVALAVIVLVLVQHGKGADMGASFGSGASNTVFGSQGSANFLSRTTAVLVAVFFVTSVGLTYYAKSKANPSLFDKAAPVATQPAEPVQLPATDDKAAAPVIDHTPAPANNQTTTNAEQNAPAKQTQTNITTTPSVNHQPAKPAAGGSGQQK